MPDLTPELRALHAELRDRRIAKLRRTLDAQSSLIGKFERTIDAQSSLIGKFERTIDAQPIPSPGDSMWTGPMSSTEHASRTADEDHHGELYDPVTFSLDRIVSFTATPQERAQAVIPTIPESLLLDRIQLFGDVSMGTTERTDLLIRLRGGRRQLSQSDCIAIRERLELERWQAMAQDFKQRVTESYAEAPPEPLVIMQTRTQRALMPLRVFARAVDWGWWVRRLPMLLMQALLVAPWTWWAAWDGVTVNSFEAGFGVVVGLCLGMIEMTLDRDWRNLYRRPARAYQERAKQIAIEDTKRAAQAGDLSIKE